MFTDILIVTALLAGQPISAQHEFADHQACLRVGTIVWHQLNSEGAKDISIRCYQEPAT